MKKLLYFTRTMALGGTENVILLLCKHFKEDFDITVVSCGGENVRKLEEMGVKHIQIGDITNKNPFNILKTLSFIKKLLKENDFDIIHTHHRMAAFYISMCKTKNSKLIHTMHNSFFDKKKMTEKSLKNFKVICCGKTVMEDTKKVYPALSSNTDFIVNTINEVKFEKVNLPKDHKFTFGFFGRLTEQKGTDFLVKTFIENDVDANLEIYGEGEQKEMLQNLVKNVHKEEKIAFKGITNNVVQSMQEVDCVLLPSRWEGLPLIVLESFYAEKPILVSDIANNLELVNKNTGLVFKVDNEADFLTMLKEATNTDLSKLVKVAKETYEKDYSNKHFYDKYLSVYQN